MLLLIPTLPPDSLRDSRILRFSILPTERQPRARGDSLYEKELEGVLWNSPFKLLAGEAWSPASRRGILAAGVEIT